MQITSRATTVRVQAASKPAVPVLKAVPRRQLLASGATFAAVLLGAAAGAQAAAESSATKAITAVNRPQQLKKKNNNREELKEQVRKVKEGEADPRSLP